MMKKEKDKTPLSIDIIWEMIDEYSDKVDRQLKSALIKTLLASKNDRKHLIFTATKIVSSNKTV